MVIAPARGNRLKVIPPGPGPYAAQQEETKVCPRNPLTGGMNTQDLLTVDDGIKAPYLQLATFVGPTSDCPQRPTPLPHACGGWKGSFTFHSPKWDNRNRDEK